MAKQAVKNTIDANIKQNGRNEITGNILNSVLTEMLNDYGERVEVDALKEKISAIATGKYYGFFESASNLPEGDDPGYAYVGSESPYAVYNFNGEEWSDSGTTIGTPAIADNEDLAQNEDGKLHFKDREATDGMGYKILRTDKTFAAQVTEANTIYEIRYGFDLDNASVPIPANCILHFVGGSISNGTLTLSQTYFSGNPKFSSVTFSGRIINEKINVRWFGAKGDGTTDDTIAIKQALQATLSTVTIGGVRVQSSALYFPAGTYNITESGIFSNATTASHFGLQVYGESYDSTRLRLMNADAEEAWYFYNNTSAHTNTYQGMYFAHLNLTGQNKKLTYGFRVYSTGHEKQLKCYRVKFDGARFFHTEGTGNADLSFFLGCSFTTTEEVIYVSNAQSVKHNFVNCDVFSYGNIVNVASGGSVYFSGSSLIMEDADDFVFDDTNTKWMVKVTGSSGGNNGVVISHCKSEMNGHCGLVYTDGTSITTFRDCNLCSANLNKVTLLSTIKADNSVIFDSCTLPQAGQFHVGDYGHNYSKPASLIITKSSFTQNVRQTLTNSQGNSVSTLRDMFVLDNSKAVIIVDNCNAIFSPSTGNSFWYTIDFTYSRDSEASQATPILKRVKFVKVGGTGGMSAGGIQETALYIPKRATLTGFNVHHVGGNALTGDLSWQLIGVKLNSSNDETEEVIATSGTYTNAQPVHEHLNIYSYNTYHKVIFRQSKKQNIGGTFYADLEYY